MVSVTDITELFWSRKLWKKRELRTMGKKILNLPVERGSHNTLLAEMPIKKLERYFFMPIFIPIWKKDWDFKIAQGKFSSFIQHLFYAESSSCHGVKWRINHDLRPPSTWGKHPKLGKKKKVTWKEDSNQTLGIRPSLNCDWWLLKLTGSV